MATSPEYLDYVLQKAEAYGTARARKMFGDAIVYIDDKPIFTVCDNTVYFKMLPELSAFSAQLESGAPYAGAKPHYILDVDDDTLCASLIPVLLAHTKVPAKRKKPV